MSAGAKKIAEFRIVTEKVVNMLSERKINVTQEGVRAFVEYANDGSIKQVNIPYVPDNATDDTLDAIRGYIDHEVAHVLFTNPAQRPPVLFAGRADLQELHSLYNIIEDTRIERHMQERFPGSAGNMANTLKFVLDKAIRPQLKNGGLSLGVMLMPLFRAYAGQRVSQEFIDTLDLSSIADGIALLEPFRNDVASVVTTQDSTMLAAKILDALNAATQPPQPPPPPPAKSESKKDKSKQDTKSSGQEGEDDPNSDDKGEEQESKQDDKKEKPEKPEKSKKKDKKEKSDKGDKGDEDEGDDADEENDGEDQDKGDEEGDDSDLDGTDKSDDEGKEESDEEGNGKGKSGDENDEADEGEDGDKEEKEGKGSGKGGNSDGDQSDGDQSDGEGEDGENGESESEENDEAAKEIKRVALSVISEITSGKGSNEAVADMVMKMIKSSLSRGAYLPFTTDNDQVIPVTVTPNRVGEIDRSIITADTRIRGMVGQLQAQMRRLFAQQAQSLNYGGQRRGRIQSSALHRLATGDDRVFFKREEHEATDTAVTLLIDLSGSMRGPGDHSDRTPKIKTACESAYALCQILDRLGIAHEVVGFTTASRYMTNEQERRYMEQTRAGINFTRTDAINFYVFKTFDERVNHSIRQRIIGTSINCEVSEPTNVRCGANVDGESVMMAARRLIVRREPRKIMMVLSDGMPAGNGSGFEEHLKKTVGDVEKMGVEMIGIGIASNAVNDFYPKRAVVNKTSDLPMVIMTQLSQLLLKRRAGA